MDEITVTVARTGAQVITVCLNGARTVLDACAAAQISPKPTEAFKVDGRTVSADYELDDGDRLILVKNIQGGR